MVQVKGQVALVTGASSGIGAAIVKLFVKEGMIVVGVARRLHRLEQLAKELKNEPGQFHYLQVDVTKEEDIKRTFKFINDTFGLLHVLINNAAIAKNTSLEDGDTKFWREILDTNVLGVAIATREGVRLMKESKTNGYIIHMNSILGHIVPLQLQMNLYAATKHAITAMTESLRQELLTEKVKIRVSSICPGLVTTEIFQAASMDEISAKIAEYPILLPEDIAESALFLITRPLRVEIPCLVIRPLGELF